MWENRFRKLARYNSMGQVQYGDLEDSESSEAGDDKLSERSETGREVITMVGRKLHTNSEFRESAVPQQKRSDSIKDM